MKPMIYSGVAMDATPVKVRAHSPTSATGTAWERTPWHATQRAAWNAHDHASRQ